MEFPILIDSIARIIDFTEWKVMQQLLMLHPDLSRFSTEIQPDVGLMGDQHASGLGKLLNEAFGETSWTAEKVRRDLIEAPDILGVFGVVDGTDVIATASARVDAARFPGQGYLHMVATGAAARGQGLGRRVTESVLSLFSSEGYSEAVLETDDWRAPALRTYLGMGFVPVIREPGEYLRWSAILATAVRHLPTLNASETRTAP